MKYKLEVLIHKPRAFVWKTFEDPQNLKKWQPSLKNVELVSGTPGQPGAVSKLTYEENERKFLLIEEVTCRDEPNRIDGTYENEFAVNTLRNTFVEKGENETLWRLEVVYKFKTLLMRILGPTMKRNFVKRSYRDMESFKEFVESL